MDYAAVPSTATTIDVLRQATITTLAASSPATGPGQPVTFTATVAATASAPARPSGTVQFLLNGTAFDAPVPLSSAGTAGATITRSQLGNYTVTAVYGGDGNYQTSTSNAVAGQVLGPGVYTVGTYLFVIGADTNDSISLAPLGNASDGSTGLSITATLNRASLKVKSNDPFTAITILGYGGNDTITLATSLRLPTRIVESNGNDSITAGDADVSVTAGNGNNNVTLGNGNNNVTLGNGNNNVALGNGSNVVIEGTGNNNVTLGNGANLAVGGLGQHTITAGNGNNILIDGSATVVNGGNSFRQILSDWNDKPRRPSIRG